MLEHYNSTFFKSLASYSYFAPKFITRGENGYLWDECGNAFLDLGMGLGSVSVGYSCPEIDNAVCHIIKYGINFSRPSIHEKELTELILEDFNLEENAVIRYSKSISMLLSVVPRVCRYITQKPYIACTSFFELRLPVFVQAFVYVLMFYAILFLNIGNTKQFIYFQF